MTAQFIPKRSSALHLMLPRHMMEPKQKLFRTSVNRIKLLSQRLRILCYSIASRMATVKTKTFFISLMIIRRQPIWTSTGDCTPRFWSIMMSPSENMVQSKRHHIIYNSFTATHHHIFHWTGKLSICSECLFQPFLNNRFRCQFRIPSQTSECIPISLC